MHAMEYGWGRALRKPAISLKWGKIGPRLLLTTNRKLLTRFRLVPKSTTLDDPEGPIFYRMPTDIQINFILPKTRVP